MRRLATLLLALLAAGASLPADAGAMTGHAAKLRIAFGVRSGLCPPSCSYSLSAGVTTGDAVYLKAVVKGGALPAGARVRIAKGRLDVGGHLIRSTVKSLFCKPGVTVCRSTRRATKQVAFVYQAAIVTGKAVLAYSPKVRVAWGGAAKEVVYPRLVGVSRGDLLPDWRVTSSLDNRFGDATHTTPALSETITWVMPDAIRRGATGYVAIKVSSTGAASPAVTFTAPAEFGAYVNGAPAGVHQTTAPVGASGGLNNASSNFTFAPTRAFRVGEPSFYIGLQTSGPRVLFEYVVK